MGTFGVGLMVGGAIVVTMGMLWDGPGLKGFGIFAILTGGLMVAIDVGVFSK